MKVTEQKAEGLKKKYQVVIENRDFEAKVEKKLNDAMLGEELADAGSADNFRVSVRAKPPKKC